MRIRKQTQPKASNFQITPLKADYLDKQLAHMKVDHLKIRNSDLTSGHRRSEMTQATTMNNSINFDDESDMPFAVANTVKHVPKKSLMLAANNLISPKASQKPMRITRGSVTFENTKQSSVDQEMRCTSMSFRNRELDR